MATGATPAPLSVLPALLALALLWAFSSAAPGEISSEIRQLTAEGRLASPSNITCVISPPDLEIQWKFNDALLSLNDSNIKVDKVTEKGEDMMYFQQVSLLLLKTSTSNHGNYTCAILGDVEQEKKVFLDLRFPLKVIKHTESPVRVKISETTYLNCIFEGFNVTEVKWRRSHNMSHLFTPENVHSAKMNETHMNGTLKLPDINRKDNGTYFCGSRDPITNKMVIFSMDVLVLDKPQVSLDFIKAVGAHKIYLNWTINDGNSPIESYGLQYRKNGTDTWMHYSTPIDGKNVSFVMTDLDPETSYQLKIDAKNSQGRGQSYSDHRWIKTLIEDPYFVPNISIKGFTMGAMTIGWFGPPENLAEYVHYYELIAKETDSPNSPEKEAIQSGNSRSLIYMFDHLLPATTYTFQVRSCSELTRECGQWSAPVNGSTLDSLAGPPSITSYACAFDNISASNFVYVAWQAPTKPNGVIKRYILELSGTASFINNNGIIEHATWGPKTRSSQDTSNSSRFDTVPPNTNFTVKVSAVTRTKRPGEPAYVQCVTPPSAPPRDSLQGVRWVKIRENNGGWMFKLFLPRVTERNGAICCYRVFLVKMKNQQKLSDMPSPEHLAISSYKKVHNGKQSFGAYVAEMFTSNSLEADVILGDGIVTDNDSKSMEQCRKCTSVLSSKTAATTPLSVISLSTVGPISQNAQNQVDNLQLEKAEEFITFKTIEEKPFIRVGSKAEATAYPELMNDEPAYHDRSKIHAKKKMFAEDSIKDNHKSLLRESSNAQIWYNDDTHSSFNDEKDFPLDNEFFKIQRIYHQNRMRPYTFEDAPDNQKSDLTKMEDIELDRDDSVVSNADENLSDDSAFELYGNHLPKSSSQKLKYLHGHKIVLRDVEDKIESSHRNEKSLSESSLLNLDGDSDGAKKLEKANDVKLTEEIVDVSKIEADKAEAGDETSIYDGPLDMDSNYTAFVEVLVSSDDSEKTMLMYSDYMNVLKPGPNMINSSDDNLELILKIVAGCAVLVFIVLIIIFVVHEHGRRKARNQGVEMHTLQSTLWSFYQGLKGGRHQLVAHSPPDIPPITKDNLLAAYTERQVDSGYGFQHEFELLPDCFHDRTMEASEARENQSKNRYPDIKSYDQTRVKLTQIDSIVGSDYINANFVMGYKERKRFICAQGPTDVTVDDFWRMIWEYNLELVIMLTNLEEYSKVKCSKYWPDQHQQDKMFNNINVHHISEKRYSDYIIRELKITKQPMTTSNSNNQIIEANGVPKKNGVSEINNGHGNTGTSAEERIVHQYHFLMWKDFVAPEYPHAILKFIKRMNEASPAGRPTLVHCSAGVGRTGTLVALDCLLQQLQAEGEASIFNTICDLRRQRNFLVQSLKQYVFVYRALVEHAQYDDTEIPASRLKSTVDRLKQTAENNDTCALEDEFEKLKQPIMEVIRPYTAGKSPEHIAKNKSESVVPYDHNRVILPPIATKENSTYINASFIEGYDNAESYIIAQDPLPTTIADFWRMVSEQEINTIVMLSELGEGKCPRYWDDDEIQYEHINVTYLLSESCPYYTRREFQVTNTKNQERVRVTQFQYHGWPTVSGQVPEVTRGIIELVGQCGASSPTGPPILVHCSLGTDRSSMFVALSILTVQLRTERRVDISTVTRKLRSLRMGCLDTYLQYEFLHRAIVNYAELHNLLSDS